MREPGGGRTNASLPLPVIPGDRAGDILAFLCSDPARAICARRGFVPA